VTAGEEPTSQTDTTTPESNTSKTDTGTTARNGGRTDDRRGRPCPLCESPMYHRHCKYICPSHGVVYDCSDTFY